ncbi:long-chain fatty alcohol dehydrogenase [Hypoxylon rubiginosum]|uniref:Long-chain fatty alcohol dehydrogenase n=1 Tax=Hypoxylon rubiginosum TaxID=110542 RepID=A0ACB9YJR3_9PEZI|nr:long-chain fatty alcohol dehydrogenase [Hypoxylon rubiginosum]
MGSVLTPPPLPPLKQDGAFTDTHWRVLFALLDATIPSIVSSGTSESNCVSIAEAEFHGIYESLQRSMKSPPSLEQFRTYMASRPSDNIKFVQNVKRTLGVLPPSSKVQLGRVLGFLGTRLGSLVSTWSLTPFADQPLDARVAVLKSWQQSWFSVWPKLARTFVSIAKTCWSQSDTLLHDLSGYTSHQEDYQPGPSVDFNFIDATLESETIDTDVAIIGSGCGGGVCAKVLSEAGRRVLVVDKGYYSPPDHLPKPMEGLQYLFQGGGSLSSADGSTFTAVASCWGGGGTVNWSGSLHTPDIVRKEWAVDDGLELFSTPHFQECLDRVCDFMGVNSSSLSHNFANRVLLEGSSKLGWKAETIPQNIRGAGHNCGSRCGFGCSGAQKQGPAVSWLPAAGKAGARFMEGLEVSKILFDDTDGRKRATGLLGTWRSREGAQRLVRVKAKKVIISAGTVNSPLILLRSGLKNPNIGSNLHLHPTGNFVATFDQDTYGWEGGILTSLVSEFCNLDGKGYGTRLEPCNMLPHYAIFGFPWHNALQFKVDALKYRQSACFIALARDRTTGKISPDPNGYPVITYTPGESDQDADFVTWLDGLEHADNKPSSAVYGSAHQMGTCRMSTSEKTGVVDQNGKVWGAEDLYIADASVFPSASGSNPMITVMAISDHIAREIATH